MCHVASILIHTLRPLRDVRMECQRDLEIRVRIHFSITCMHGRAMQCEGRFAISMGTCDFRLL